MDQRKALAIVRIYGPASCAELAQRACCDRDELYRAMFRLNQLGLMHNGPGRYELSDKGRRLFDEEFSQPLFKAGPWPTPK